MVSKEIKIKTANLKKERKVLRFFRKSKRQRAEVDRFFRKRENGWDFFESVGNIGPGIFYKREKHFRIFLPS
jgi:hypothetical protein